MADKKKPKNIKERIRKELELVKKLKEKKQEERESLEQRMTGKPAKSKTIAHGEHHEKFMPGHHGNR